MDVLPREEMGEFAAVGELSLDGTLNPVAGVLPAAMAANGRELGLVCPAAQGGEAAWAGPVADAGGPYTGVAGSEVTLDASASDVSLCSAVRYAWDCDNDGTIDETTTAFDDDGDGYSEDAGDCDDSTTAMSPGAAESADWLDNDCDGIVDEGTTAYDDDGDGFTEVGGDCDDTNASIHPAALEVSGNGIDEDCSASTGT